MNKIPLSFRKGLQVSFSIIAGISTIVSLWGYTIKDIYDKWPWWAWALILLIVYILLTVIISVLFCFQEHKGYQTTINGKNVSIIVGDIFLEKGWKVIPFNEKFDTKVDDIVIAHNTLNGKMIDNYIDDLPDLNNTITAAASDNSHYKPTYENGEALFPLGRIIPYKEYLLLSFTHFDSQKRAYLGVGDYEQLLFRMWEEMRRVYAAKHIVLPLLGAGITSINGIQEKDYTTLLKCILCTLRNSRFQPEDGITIVLTKETIKKINMNTIKEEF